MLKKKGFLKQGEFDQDFELNIASIIDCFVVLIAFVLVSTSFFSIGIIDAEVAGASDAATSSPQATPAAIELRADHSIVLKSGMFGQNVTKIAALASASGAAWNYARLASSLATLTTQNPELKSAIVSAENSVSYRDVMASMEVAKGKIAQVNLGGF
jgi:biopolymer transport protein ExbD